MAPLLETLISDGSREEAAVANILRGDLKASQKKLNEAVLDYLRTALLFEAQADANAEALFKAAETLTTLKDRRAKDLYKKLVDKHPDSGYAQKAQGKF